MATTISTQTVSNHAPSGEQVFTHTEKEEDGALRGRAKEVARTGAVGITNKESFSQNQDILGLGHNVRKARMD